MKYFLLWSLSILLSSVLFAQTTIVGQLKSIEDEVIFDVMVFNGDSILVLGNSYTTAQFQFETKIEPGYYLQIRSLGYQSLTFSLENKPLINLGDVQLEEASFSLNEITLTELNKVIRINEKGNTLIDVSNSSLAKSGMGIDLVKKLPGIMVVDNQIEVLGKGKPLIIIDGVASSFFEFEALSSDQIASVEIIKNPSSQYSASANCVIKISTLYQKYKGWNMTMMHRYSKATFDSYYSSISFAYKKRKATYNFYLRYNPQKNRHSDEYRRMFEEINYQVNNTVTRDTDRNKNIALDFKTIQELNDSQKIQFSSKNYLNKGTEQTKNINYINNFLSIDTLKTSIYSPFDRITHKDALTYFYDLDTLGQQMKLTVDYLFFSEENIENINELFSDTTRESKSDFANRSHVFSIESQYNLPLKDEKLFFKMGAKHSILKSESNYSYFLDRQNEIKERTTAAYIEMDKKFTKTDLLVGLRYETVQSTGLENKEYKLFDRKFNNLFPNAFIQYRMTDNLKSNLTYSYKTKRPNIYDTTNYSVFVDSLTAFSGNPNLVPEFSHLLDYGLVYKDFASFDVSYVNTKNPIHYYINYDGINTSVVQDNFTNSEKLSISLNLPYQTNTWTTFNSLGYIKQQNVYTEKAITRQNTMFYVACYNEFKIRNWFKLDVLYQYNTAGLIGLLSFEPRHVVNLNLSRSIKNNQIEFFVAFNDVFNQDIYQLSSQIQSLSVTDRKFNDQQRIRFGVYFKLNRIDNYIKSKNNIKDETQRIKKQ